MILASQSPVHGRAVVVVALWVAAAVPALASGPSFDCAKVEPGSIEEMVCKDATLAALDVKLAEVYAAASAKAADEHPPVLKAEQRGWVKGRDDCWKAEDKRQCVESAYAGRIAELQARYRLLAPRETVTYACDGNAANELTVSYFATDPPTLIAERGDSTSLMLLATTDGLAKYVGRNETLREQKPEVVVVWGYEAPEMRCSPKAKP